MWILWDDVRIAQAEYASEYGSAGYGLFNYRLRTNSARSHVAARHPARVLADITNTVTV